MSRIGNTPITIPTGVNVTISDNVVTVKGPKGQLVQEVPATIAIKQEKDTLTFSRRGNNPKDRALHGLSRALIANLVEGVTNGYKKELEMVGTGYRVSKTGTGLQVTVGFSHPVDIIAVDNITYEIEGNNKIIISGIDKQLVGQVAANIRKIRPPEPYKGKGIRYSGEVVRRKAGKAAKAAAA